MNDIGMEIRTRRKELGLKVYELADQVGVHAVYITKIEKHNQLPSPVIFRRICTALNLPNELYNSYFKDKYGDSTEPSDLITDEASQKLPLTNPGRHGSSLFPRLPRALANEFKTPQAEQIARFIHRQVTSHSMPSKDRYEALLKEIAPNKTADLALFSKVHDILLEMKKADESYWQEFITKSKQIESLVLPPNRPQS